MVNESKRLLGENHPITLQSRGNMEAFSGGKEELLNTVLTEFNEAKGSGEMLQPVATEVEF